MKDGVYLFLATGLDSDHSLSDLWSFSLLISPHTGSFRHGVSRIRQRFDDELRAILQSALLLLSTTDGPSSTATSAAGGYRSQYGRMASSSGYHVGGGGSSQGGGASGKDVASARAAELEPYIQDKCAEMAAAVAAHLRKELERLGEPQQGAAGAAKAEQVSAPCQLQIPVPVFVPQWTSTASIPYIPSILTPSCQNLYNVQYQTSSPHRRCFC